MTIIVRIDGEARLTRHITPYEGDSLPVDVSPPPTESDLKTRVRACVKSHSCVPNGEFFKKPNGRCKCRNVGLLRLK